MAVVVVGIVAEIVAVVDVVDEIVVVVVERTVVAVEN